MTSSVRCGGSTNRGVSQMRVERRNHNKNGFFGSRSWIVPNQSSHRLVWLSDHFSGFVFIATGQDKNPSRRTPRGSYQNDRGYQAQVATSGCGGGCYPARWSCCTNVHGIFGNRPMKLSAPVLLRVTFPVEDARPGHGTTGNSSSGRRVENRSALSGRPIECWVCGWRGDHRTPHHFQFMSSAMISTKLGREELAPSRPK